MIKRIFRTMQFILYFSVVKLSGQQIEFKVEVSSDTVLLGNYVEVKFTVLNGEGKFIPPAFTGLKIIAGPNRASSYSMVNGVVSQSNSYTYYIEPEIEGDYIIDEAKLKASNAELKTPELKLVVVANPTGIKQSPRGFDNQNPIWKGNPKPEPKKKAKQSFKI